MSDFGIDSSPVDSCNYFRTNQADFILDVPYPPLSWKEQLKELAQILDKQETYQQLMADYWQRIEKLKQAFGDRRQEIEVSVAGQIT